MKFLRKAAACVIAAGMVTTSAYAYVDSSLVFTVHESEPMHYVDMDMYGVGSEWPASANAHLVNYASGSGINMDFVRQMKEQGLSMEHFRQAGVSSTGFMWKESLGSYDERSEMNMGINSINHMKPVFGVLEQAKLVDAFNPGKGTISYTVNLQHEQPSSMADLAEFFYGDGKKNYNGGINLAQKRIAGGHPNPVNVSEWEMGNEYDGGGFSHMFINYRLYVQKCKEVIGAIKSVKEDAPIALTLPVFGGGAIKSDWTYAVLDELGNEASYVVEHGYTTMDSAYKRDDLFMSIGEMLDKKFGKGRLRIVCTEHNSQTALTLLEGTDVTEKGWGPCMYFGGGRGTADFYARLIKYPYVCKTNLFATSTGTSYSTFYVDNDGKYKLNAAAMATAMFQNDGIQEGTSNNIIVPANILSPNNDMPKLVSTNATTNSSGTITVDEIAMNVSAPQKPEGNGVWHVKYSGTTTGAWNGPVRNYSAPYFKLNKAFSGTEVFLGFMTVRLPPRELTTIILATAML